MGLVDKFRFEQRGARGVSNSDYDFRLSAYGVFRGDLVLGVELPRAATGTPAGLISVNYSGPALRPDGTPNWAAPLTLLE